MIYIGQYHGKSWTSKLIQWRTWSDISHTAAWFQLPNLDWEVIEAWGGGVRRGPWLLGHTKGTRIDVYGIEATKAQKENFRQLMLDAMGRQYDFGAILGFALRIRSQDPEKEFCSELVFSRLQQVGIHLLRGIEAYKVHPGLIGISPLLTPLFTKYSP
jgi:hypothetical protein